MNCMYIYVYNITTRNYQGLGINRDASAFSKWFVSLCAPSSRWTPSVYTEMPTVCTEVTSSSPENQFRFWKFIWLSRKLFPCGKYIQFPHTVKRLLSQRRRDRTKSFSSVERSYSRRSRRNNSKHEVCYLAIPVIFISLSYFVISSF